jgi:two-component system, NarL family, response regulator YdfI
MVAIAIFSADPAMRRSLEQLLREDSTFSIVGVVDDPAAISLLIDQNHANVVLADVPLRERLADWRLRHNQTAFVIFVDGADEEDSLDALYAGARAILPRTAKPDEIITTIKAVTNGLAVLPGEPEVVTHVLGTICHPSLRAGQFRALAEGVSALTVVHFGSLWFAKAQVTSME